MPIQTTEIDSWNELEAFVDSFRADLQSRFRGRDVRLLYRGQSSYEWDLETSLLRKARTPISMKQYDHLLHRICPAVQALTDRSWPLTRDGFQGVEDVHRPFYIPNYEFMAYARHHGFPTPLLDWTKSPYVALFFAMNNCDEEDSAALFVYLDELRIGRAGWVGSQRVISQGEYIAPHRRHFIQQSVYTTCTKMVDGVWLYASHQEYFENPNDRVIVAKVAIPGSRKAAFMEKLEAMNINAFTLFGSEEGLMHMLWNREAKGIGRPEDPIPLDLASDGDDST
jgi:hypothetical protein